MTDSWPPTGFGRCENDELIDEIESGGPDDVVAIEMVESFGMPVGREVFETCYWIGRFAQAARPLPHALIPRGAIKLHLCGSKRAKDSNIRAALLDRFGGKEAAIGRKAAPGPLWGIHGDVWQALAVAVTWHDQRLDAHDELHAAGRISFATKYAVDLEAIARDLWASVAPAGHLGDE